VRARYACNPPAHTRLLIILFATYTDGPAQHATGRLIAAAHQIEMGPVSSRQYQTALA